MLNDHGRRVAEKLKKVHDTVVQRTTEYNGSAGESDPYHTYTLAAELAHTDTYTAIHTRLNEKLIRLSSLSEPGIPELAAIAETCGDIIGHAVLLWEFVERHAPKEVVPVIPEPNPEPISSAPVGALEGLKTFFKVK
jgi:hypothetical protein